MRQITINMWQNLGTQTVGSQCILSGQVVDLADFTQEVDGKMNLTKITPGNMTCKVLDPNGSIEAFMESNLGNVGVWRPSTAYYVGTLASNGGNAYRCATAGTSAASGGPAGTTSGITDGTCIWDYMANPIIGLIPPWVEVYVGGVRVFLGTADPSRIVNRKSARDYSIQVAAVDWSMQLASTYLGSPTAPPWQPNTPYPQGYQVTNGGSTYQASNPGTSGITGPAGALPGMDGTINWIYLAPPWQRPVPAIATNGISSSETGFVPAWGVNGSFGWTQGMGTIYFPDPCEWIHKGAILQLTTRPILLAIGKYDSRLVDNGAGNQVWAYITPATLPPANLFSVGMIVQACHDNTGAYTSADQRQVSTDGLSWAAVYDTSAPSIYAKVFNYLDLQFAPLVAWGTNISAPQCNVIQLAPQGATPWPVLPVMPPVIVNGGINGRFVTFDSVCQGFEAGFSLSNPTAQDLDYWIVEVEVPQNPPTPCYTLILNSVNGIVVGDKVGIVGTDSTQSWTVVGVDPTLNSITTQESISNVPSGAHIYWTPDSQTMMVMEDPTVILRQAIAPFQPDLSKFSAPITALPIFGFLPLRPAAGNDLFPIGDIEPTLTGIKISTGGTWIDPNTPGTGPSYLDVSTWTGTPDGSGWTGPSLQSPAPNADWTSQLVAAPASLMPYEPSVQTVSGVTQQGINPFQVLRNRAYGDFGTNANRRENNGLMQVQFALNGTVYLLNGAYVQTPAAGATPEYTFVQDGVTYTTGVNSVTLDPWTPVGANVAGQLVAYDYQTMTRYIFNYGLNSMGQGTLGQVQIAPWSGSAWGTPSTKSWPSGTNNYIQSAVPMIGSAGLVLAYVASAVIGNTVNNSPWATATVTGDCLQIWNVSSNTVLTTYLLPTSLQGGALVTTPYGVFLVNGSTIAQVSYAGGNILLSTLYMPDQVDVLFANTLVARTSSEIVVFGRIDNSSAGSSLTETRVFRITIPFASTLDASTLWSEKIAVGSPTLMGCMRDPSTAGASRYSDPTTRRIIGHYGGSLFQIDNQRPLCLERFSPGGMTAMELIEHICQLYNALAIPDATGTMHIVSRVQNDSPIALTVNQIQADRTVAWADFANIVRITSQDNATYYDAKGQVGVNKLEINNHPLVWSDSACAAMAESLVQWFGVPRVMREEQWFYTDPNTGAPWETIQLFSKLTVNGGSPVRLMKISQNYVKGTAKVTTVGA